MDASKITELRQKQANRYINRAQCVDSSTLTWMNQIRSSTFLPSLIPNSPNYSQVISCNNCSAESKIALSSNSVGAVAAKYPNPTLGSGSATTVYTAQNLTMYKAGHVQCCEAPLNTPQNPIESQFITLPDCYCSNSNAGPFSETNPDAMVVPEGGYNLYLPIPTTVPPACAIVPTNAGTRLPTITNGPCVYGNPYVPVDPYACKTDSIRATNPVKLP